MARTLTTAVAALAAALTLGCPKKELPQQGGLGRRVADGAVAALRASPDGAWLAWLGACAPVTAGYVPRGTRSCELRVAPSTGPGAADARVVAQGVSTLPHGFAWTADGTLLALEAYDHVAGTGRLVASERGGPARPLADGVSFYAAAPGGRIGWVARGALSIAAAGGAPAAVPGATRVATFEFAPDGRGLRLLARREAAAGGELLALADGGAVRTVAAAAGDYRFSPRGDFAYTARAGEAEALSFARADLRAAPVRGNVQTFAFAPAGDAVAFTADLAPGRQGDLWVARLPAGGAPGAPEKLAEGVGDYRWAAAAPRLAWLERFDPATRSGALAAGAPGEKPARLGEKVSSYELSADGAQVAFLEHVLAGGYSVDLKLASVGAGAAEVRELAKGAFGFEFAPERDFLWYRSGCTANGETCDLSRVALAAGAKPEAVAQGVRTFDFDRRSPGRVLLGWARSDRPDALDLGVWAQGRVVKVDRGALAGSAAFLDATRLAYAVVEKGREGVYVAEVK